jgi:hypothetical protein
MAESIDIRPNSKGQMDFFAATEYEVLFGGASFGGKTWCVVVDPLPCIGTPDYTAVIFRRSYPELEGQIVPLTMKYYPHFGGKYNDQKKLWTFPSGATIKLGYLQFKDDWRNHMGMDYTDEYFDEASNIHWENMEMLKTWNRTRCRIKPRRRFASNPGGISHVQLKSYFIDKCQSIPDGDKKWSELAKMWWQPMKKGKPYEYFDTTTKQTLNRQYIPARAFDNEDGLRLNPTYLMQLLSLPTERRKAYLEGDWGVFEGQFFSDFSPDIHIKSPVSFSDYNIPMSSVRGGLDYGNTTVLEVMFRDYEGNIVCFGEYYNDNRQSPTERFEDMAEFLIKNKLHKLQIIHDTDMSSNALVYAGQEKNPLSIAREVFKLRMGSNAPIMRVVSKKSEEDKKYRVACNEAFKDYLHWKKSDSGEFIRRPRVYFTSNCPNLIRTLPELIHDPDSLGGLDFDKDVGEDHPFDSFKYGFMDLRTPMKIHEPHELGYIDKIFQKIHEKIFENKDTAIAGRDY